MCPHPVVKVWVTRPSTILRRLHFLLLSTIDSKDEKEWTNSPAVWIWFDVYEAGSTRTEEHLCSELKAIIKKGEIPTQNRTD